MLTGAYRRGRARVRAAGMWEIPADCGQTETFLSSRNSKSTLNLIDCLCCWICYLAHNSYIVYILGVFPSSSVSKASACNTGDQVSIPGLERFLGKGNGNSIQCPCLENSMDRGDWWAIVHEVAKSQTWLSN